MKVKLLAILSGIAVVMASAFCLFYLSGSGTRMAGDEQDILQRTNLSEISSTPIGKMIRFEAVIVDQTRYNCIELFLPKDFEAYGGDAKWAISSMPGFQLGWLSRPAGKSRGIVTGKYVRLDVDENGPCNLINGTIFEIDAIEYP